ncbi:guanosine-3',5'-bis 3'-pyrophosphohydrolase MESH1-like protein [Rhizoclosmatium globosum]|uniref:Guanosine-3',5'-bis(diphosphate) 3'-pyrophosphohydrolase MESH1 n=1 Tax=Rhizoclosmatium globosum TaxID=329046 RepID=A0A1Y2CZ79_9FUNG|nr:guanosine-3',5'-bis 3'-pyrophosphohydrolase MESH1-like protein [Rhizoclosmatium globosum]|eukprot:ORY51655.1 guanosine-3',5'-bis 3'-pyrophosphohydrolase MESH1-like protein [Rhizoclosmatium globosum]
MNTDLATLVRAVDFAATKHTDQRRRNASATPYVNHVIGVTRILVEAGVGDVSVLAAALLHDTIEDTDTTSSEIEHEFGVAIRTIVDEVTDDKSLEKHVRKQAQIDKAPASSTNAKLVKLADKIHNLRSIEGDPPVGWDEKRISDYFDWAEKVTNGCRGVNAHMEAILDDLYSAHRTKRQQ